jgi:sulfite reductase alpha subunit-like flavoprotein
MNSSDSTGRRESYINDLSSSALKRYTLVVRPMNNMKMGMLTQSGQGRTCLLIRLRNDTIFLPWSIDFRRHLLEDFPLPDGIEPIADDVLLSPKWTLETIEEPSTSSDPLHSHKSGVTIPPDSSVESQAESSTEQEDILPIPGSVIATLKSNTRVTAKEHWQDVRELTFTIPEKIEYAPGDILSIYPKNAAEDVDSLVSLLEWSDIVDHPVRFCSIASSSPQEPVLPYLLEEPKLTIRRLLMDYLDITAIPNRYFFFQLAHFTTDEMHKERLLEFANPIYREELYNYTSRPRRSILEVLHDFPSVKIPWQQAAAVFPRLRHRQFSIASGGKLKHDPEKPGQTQIQILVAIVKYQTILRKIRRGVCTRYLAQLPTGSKITVTINKGGMGASPDQASKPVVMVAPGTGLAPMRSFIWERASWAQNSDIELGESILFYGSRKRDADYFYKDEWEGEPNDNKKLPVQVFTAFSRDQREKIYVQDIIRKQAALVYRLLKEEVGGTVYVCGSSGKMPKSVREAFIFVFEQEGKLDREDAERYVAKMEKEGRYKLEVW